MEKNAQTPIINTRKEPLEKVFLYGDPPIYIVKEVGQGKKGTWCRIKKNSVRPAVKETKARGCRARGGYGMQARRLFAARRKRKISCDRGEGKKNTWLSCARGRYDMFVREKKKYGRKSTPSSRCPWGEAKKYTRFLRDGKVGYAGARRLFGCALKKKWCTSTDSSQLLTVSASTV